VTEDSVTTPEQIIKTTDRWELSQNLAKTETGEGGLDRRQHVGTRYHYADTYGIILKRQALKARVYPATHDGTFDGTPVLMTADAWAKKKRDSSRATLACQQLLNPIAGELQELDLKWVQRWEVRPERINVAITVDPANSRKKESCNSAFIVQGVDALGNWYFLDGAVHKLSLKERWEMLLYLWLKWSRAPGVLLCLVGYERYGLQADLDYFEIEMQRMPPNRRVSIPVTEVSWVSDGSQAKDDRIRRIIPDMQKRKYFWPYDGELTKRQLQAKDLGKHYLISGPIKRKNDQERKGHWMRFGKSLDPELDINHQLGLLMDTLGTRPSTLCLGDANRGRRCKHCQPLFPRLNKDPLGNWILAPNPEPTPALVSSMVVAALRMINVDTASFSGVCCRMGGLTVATEAGVPENILWMQSGHAQDRAARRYVRLTNPDRLYDTWRAFRL
jgi:hypothetical protein